VSCQTFIVCPEARRRIIDKPSSLATPFFK
jgi:hypothetical protein